MKFKTLGVASSLAIVACMTTPAFAQNQPAPADEAPAADENRTSDIVVTAEFREARLQDTPIAITAVDAEMLEARGQTDVAQIAAQAPNVTLKPQGQGGGAGLIAYIRGVGQTDFIYARDPGVGVYIDDVYIPTLQSSLIELMDLERIEILRGPQGTLAGKNSIGGSIRLFGVKPKGDGSGSLELSYGSYNDIRLRGYGDFALSDNLAVRISGMARNTDGYVKLIDYGLTHPTSNVPANESIGRFPEAGEMGGRNLVAGRIAFDWQPNDRLNVYVTADITNQDGDPGAAVLIAAGAPAPSATFNGTGQNPAVDTGGSGTPWLRGKNGAAVTIGCQFVPNGVYSCDTPPSGYDRGFISYANYMDAMAPTITAPFKPYFAIPKNTFEGWGVHGTVTYDISDATQVVWISSYRKYESTWAEDQDLTSVGESQLNNINRHWAWSQELRLNFGFGDGLVEGTVGGFYFDQYGEYEARVDLNYVAAGGPPFLAAPIDFIHGPDETPSESKAVFANVTVHPTDGLSLTGGLRYSDESKDYVYYRRNPDYTAPNAAICAQPGLVGVRQTSNCALVGFLGAQGNFADTRVDWRAVADYRFSDSLLVYVSAATGFKGGGVNPRPFVADQALPFNPETLTTYEAGFKSDFWDRRVRLNGAVFFNDYADVQGTKLVCPESSLPSPCLRPANVGQAEMKGFELEGQFYPADGLSIDASVAYLDFEYTGPFEGSALIDHDNNPATARVRGPATGTCTDFLQNTSIGACTTTPYTPKWTYSAGIQYDHEMDAGVVSFRVDGAYQSDIFTTSENSPFSLIDDYFIGNARLWFTTEDEGWEVYAEVKNLFDQYYFLSKSDASSSLGVVTGMPGLPRTFTLGVKKNF